MPPVMPAAKVASLEFLFGPAPDPSGGASAGVRVLLEDGTSSAFVAATPGEPGRWLKDNGWSFCHGTPVLYVRTLDPAAARAAVEAMAATMGGYWLRYYDSPAEGLQGPGGGGPRREGGPAKRAAGAEGLRVTRAEIAHAEPAGSPERCSAVVEIQIADGRRFSVLAATPAWFEEVIRRLDLPCYYGPQVLFLSAMEPALARRAAQDMASRGDRWLCVYDTPRRTLPQVLAEFKARQR